MRTELVIGGNYGKWSVVAFDKVDERRRRRYICKCECGLTKSIVASALAAGRTTSCSKCRADDLTGREFGKWLVLSRQEESSKHQHTVWLCRCVCGKESVVERCNLVRGVSRGCWECQRNVISTVYFPRIWYRKQFEQAKIRKIAWNVTEEYLWQVWTGQNGKCALTGMELTIETNPKNMTASLDRIDSDVGYEIGNVWFVHKHVNMMKYKYPLDYFVSLCRMVAENRR